jgi:hypothetical protein
MIFNPAHEKEHALYQKLRNIVQSSRIGSYSPKQQVKQKMAA